MKRIINLFVVVCLVITLTLAVSAGAAEPLVIESENHIHTDYCQHELTYTPSVDEQVQGISVMCGHMNVSSVLASSYFSRSGTYCSVWVGVYNVVCSDCGTILGTYNEYIPTGPTHVMVYDEGMTYCMNCWWPYPIFP